MTARRGGRARVPTVVATAFAVSWKPLVKSKVSATAIVRTRRKVCASGILDHDALEHVRHLLAAVEGVLKEYVQVLHVNKSLFEETGNADECSCLLLEEIVKAPLAGDQRALYSVS